MTFLRHGRKGGADARLKPKRSEDNLGNWRRCGLEREKREKDSDERDGEREKTAEEGYDYTERTEKIPNRKKGVKGTWGSPKFPIPSFLPESLVGPLPSGAGS